MEGYLATPCTAHVPYNKVYEPSEDSFLLLDTLSSLTERKFLADRFPDVDGEVPVVLELGSGSGVVVGFVMGYFDCLFGRSDGFGLAVDANVFACEATVETVNLALNPTTTTTTTTTTGRVFGGAINGSLVDCIRDKSIDIIIFNPPYVPSDTTVDPTDSTNWFDRRSTTVQLKDEVDLIELACSGGKDGMEVTDRLINDLDRVLHPTRGLAYILLCERNRPEEVKQRVLSMGCWKVDLISKSGSKGGWERLGIMRISRK